MTKNKSAKEIIKETYDYETCKEIYDSGVEGNARDYSTQEQTIPFYDQFKQEIIDYIVDSLGQSKFDELSDETDDINEFKHECAQTFILFIAMEKVHETDEKDLEDLEESGY